MASVQVWLTLSCLSAAACGASWAEEPRADAGSAVDSVADAGRARFDAARPSAAGHDASDPGVGSDAGDAWVVDGSIDDASAAWGDASASDGGSDAGASDGGSDAGASDGGSDASASDGGSDAGASDGGSDAGASDGGSDASAPRVGGNTLWIGNSLVRHRANGPYPAYDVPAVVQDLHAASGRDARQEMRVLAQDGFDLFGWWVTWYGYTTPAGEIISAARAITEDGAAARTYDSGLEYTALAPGQRWNRIVLLSTANHFVSPDRWYGSLDSGAIVPNMERWYAFVGAVDPAIEILHYEGVVDSRTMELQPEVDRLFDELQARWHGRIVPVGRAFASSVAARPDLDLRRTLVDDYMHFSQPGVYLAACVFFAVLYGDPAGLPVTSGLAVSDVDAAFLQGVARDAVAAVGSLAR